LLSGGSILGHDLYLGAKELLARVLIRQAFARHLADGNLHPPWAWADMAPVARLEIPDGDIRRYVLTGATGESLAFDVGHIHGTAYPNRAGNCVLTGHRDGRFAFLETLRPGDLVVVRSFRSTRRYRVDSTSVVSAGDTAVLENDGDRLTLVTCWPFNGLTRSSLRYVVSCVPADGVRYASEKSRWSAAGLVSVAAGDGG
jgi:sortase A